MPNELRKINQHTLRKFSEDEVYMFNVILCDNEIDRDGEAFSVKALKQMKKLFVGVTGITDHDPKSANQNARIFDTKILDFDTLTAYGEPYKQLQASAYTVRTDGNKDLIAEIEGGIKKEVSVSFRAENKKCSICGKSYGECEHRFAETYDGQKQFIILDDVTDAYEWSFVAVPAQPAAGVTKEFEPNREEKEMGKTEEINLKSAEKAEKTEAEKLQMEDEKLTAKNEKLKAENETLKAEIAELKGDGESKSLETENAELKSKLANLELEKLIRDKGYSGKSAKLAAYEIGDIIKSGVKTEVAAEKYFTENPPEDDKKSKVPQFVPSTSAGGQSNEIEDDFTKGFKKGRN
jgi:cell division protein FtsB